MKQAMATIIKPLPDHLFRVHGNSAEMRWEAMSGLGYHTPADRFFVRNHTTTPIIDVTTWQLRIHGDGVRCPRVFGYEDLRAMPSRTFDVAIECAGNGRRFYRTQQHDGAPGTQWGLGAIGVARWRGVPLRYLLKEAGVLPGAVDVLPTGLDAPFEGYGHVRRPLPIAKAMDDVLVAYEMNGEPLPPDHGFPVRLVVPGWVGIASIKWLGDIEVSTRELFTPWNTVFYRDVTTQPVKSAFELAWNARLPVMGPHVLRGRSWSGRGRIVRVEVSFDEGMSWRAAEHHGQHLVSAWLPWHIAWAPRRTGPRFLMARATDETGATQPLVTPRHPFGYHFDAVVQHPIHVVNG
ncbi:Mo-co oxidoreductase dimerisation domain-containing protein [Nonomuraea solani]|uniref:Mo-co oxidoreductase dimerisation domain-containing protein n=1 Tax=Nonomuraea solani TaxID=1144553 RepID=A0A1H5YK60_9ACTN|nr:sulfite oxidase [Nonomuraea solani]SEG24100.1 Mo-co oxidoreductase dimerisation domain-containing protein [Nonomuraea solani]